MKATASVTKLHSARPEPLLSATPLHSQENHGPELLSGGQTSSFSADAPHVMRSLFSLPSWTCFLKFKAHRWYGQERAARAYYLPYFRHYTLLMQCGWQRFLARGHTSLHLLPSKVQTHCFKMEPKRSDLKNKDIRSRACPKYVLPAIL